MTTKTKAQIAKVRSAVRKHLLQGVAKQAGVDTAQAALDTARGGMYACTVMAAIAADGDKVVFIETTEALMTDFRGNVRGIAVKYNMEQAKDKQGKLQVDGDGNPRYKVPGSLSTAKSVLGKAFDNAIDLGTTAKPESFGAIRTANDIARDETAKAAATPTDKTRQSIQGKLDKIGAALPELSNPALKALDKLLNAVVEQACKAKPTSAASAKRVA